MQNAKYKIQKVAFKRVLPCRSWQRFVESHLLSRTHRREVIERHPQREAAYFLHFEFCIFNYHATLTNFRIPLSNSSIVYFRDRSIGRKEPCMWSLASTIILPMIA